MKTRYFLRFGTVFLALVLLPPALTAQQQEPPPERTFGESIDVRVIEVETVVTGPGGKRLEGLGPEDFRLLVDGEEVEIGYFDEVRGGDRVVRAAEGEAPAATATAAGPGRRYLVFIDDYYTDRRLRKRLLENLADNLGILEAGDEMAVVRFEGFGLEVVTGWTASREKLTTVLDEVRERTPGELLRDSRVRAHTDPVLAARAAARQISEVASAMSAAMRAFSEAPGRKLFVPVTTGWQFDTSRRTDSAIDIAAAEEGRSDDLVGPSPDLQPLVFDEGGPEDTGPGRQSEIFLASGIQLLAPMVDTANLLGYSIYPMHVGRLGGAARSDDVAWASLRVISEQTGGRIVTEGAANLTPLEPVLADTGSYYVLGFTPARSFDNRRHRIQVEVTDPEAKEVRHRRSYLDLSRRAQTAMATEAALLLGEVGGDLDVTAGRQRKGGRGVAEVPVTIRIPMDWVTMVPAGNGEFRGELELRVAAVDERGERSEIPAIPIGIQGPEPPPGSHFTYETVIQLRKAGQRLVLFLYDTLSGESMSSALELEL